MNTTTYSNRWLFVFLTFTYLLFEFSFNARLLDVVGGKPDQDALQNIEIFGRLLSGVGCTLMIWRWIVKSDDGTLSALFRFMFCGLLIVPSVYFGQRFLIEYLVDRTPIESRASAALASQIPQALIWDAVSIKGLDLPAKTWEKAEGKTFLATLPLLAFSSPELLGSGERQIKPLVTWIVKQRVGSPEAAYNKYYISLANDVRNHFNGEYRVASEKLLEQGSLQGNEDALWDEYTTLRDKQPFTQESVTPTQRAAVISQLRRRGLNVPDNWNLYDRSVFNAALPSAQGQASYRVRMDEVIGHSTTIPPGLSWHEFNQHPDIQSLVRTKFHNSMPNLEIGNNFINLDASIEEFKTSYFNREIQRITDRETTRIKSPPSSYGNGMPNYEFGRQSMRAVIVPPIALSSSLFFSLCNLAGLVALLIPGGTIIKYTVQIAFMCVVLLFPLFISNEINSSKAYQNLETSLQKKSPTISIALHWLVHSEPIYYSLGRVISQSVRLI